MDNEDVIMLDAEIESEEDLMRAIVVKEGGDEFEAAEADALEIQWVQKPIPNQDEVLIKVAFAGVNWADIQRRRYMKRADKTVSKYLGIECSGIVDKVGGDATQIPEEFKEGNKVCAITEGGSYAEYVVVPVAYLLPVAEMSLEEAATYPHVLCTLWSELFMVHGGSSGIEYFLIQMAKLMDVTVFVVADTEEIFDRYEMLKDDRVIACRKKNFLAEVLGRTKTGVDVILDCIGDPLLVTIDGLISGGCLITLGTPCMSSSQQDAFGTTEGTFVSVCDLQNRLLGHKAMIVDEVKKNIWPKIEKDVKVRGYQNNIKNNRFEEATDAHRCMEAGRGFDGKILLSPGSLT